MTWRRLLWSSLWQARGANACVLLGVALGTAVLTGALLLGDSLQTSLRVQTLDRLGRIDLAVLGEQFFPATLVHRLTAASGPAVHAAAGAILLRGSVVSRSATGQTRWVGRVHIIGVDDRFWPLFNAAPRRLRSEALINAPLADDLGVQVGDPIEIRLELPHVIPADTIVGRRTNVEGLLLPLIPVVDFLPLEGVGRFSLAAEQTEPRLVYVDLESLQRRLREEGLQPQGYINAVLLATGQVPTDLAGWQARLKAVAELEDLGLELRPDASEQRYLSLSSRRMLIQPEVSQIVQETARVHDWQCLPTLTYLANLTFHLPRFPALLAAAVGRLAPAATPFDLAALPLQAANYVPYAAVTALDPSLPPPWGPFVLVSGDKPRPLRDDEILVTDHLARDLWPMGDWSADIGRRVVCLRYFMEGSGNDLRETHHLFTLAGVVSLEGFASDRSLTPEFPGMTSRNLRDWKPPFPRSLWHPEWIRERDEQFYRHHKVAPRAFVSPATARRLWQSRYGQETSLRLAAPPIAPGDLSPRVRAALKPVLSPEQQGLIVVATRDQLLAATRSGTALMFGWLFVGFSFFLIIAAGLLISLFVRLRLEQRQRELGLFYALGFPNHSVRRLLLREGFILAASGAFAGVVLGVGYAWLLIHGLRWGWQESISSSFLQFHLWTWATPWGDWPSLNLGVGWAIGVIVSWMTIRLAIRGWEKLAPLSLLGGWRQPEETSRRHRRWSWIVVVVGSGGGVALALASGQVQPAQAPGLFFAAGFLILLAGLALVRAGLLERSNRPFANLSQLSLAQLCRQPRRGMLTVALLASGVFLVLAVEAFRKSPRMERARTGGTGGFSFVAESTVPLPWMPSDEASWQRFVADAMNSPDTPPPWPAELSVIGFRLRPGDDVSCLNLYAPRQPRVLGVPPAMVQRGGFSFILPSDASPAEQENPWLLLDRNVQDAVPLLADDHTAQWILQKKVGDVWEIFDEAGRPCRVQLVGMLKSSLFQSELLIAERHFLRLFPSRAGYAFFLVDCPDSATKQVYDLVANFLGEPFGFTLVSASERLARFQAVENTYLSTFQVLGGLGLLFGVAGLAIVLVRNFQERLTEYALLVALGYSQRHLKWLALVEQGILIGTGIAVGLTAAFVAVTPLWLSQAGEFPWLQILLLVTLLILVGSMSGWFAIRYVLRVPLLAALRRG